MNNKEKNISNIKNLLVVDDDQRIRDLLKEYLIKEGFIISTADCAENARKKMQYVTYDLIILDVMMPGDDGLKFTTEIRQSSQTPIILLTAKSEIDSKIEGLEKAADLGATHLVWLNTEKGFTGADANGRAYRCP